MRRPLAALLLGAVSLAGLVPAAGADDPAEPRYPVDNATTVVARITDPWATSFMETIADPAGHVYRVVAVDSERRLIASSPAARPQPLA